MHITIWKLSNLYQTVTKLFFDPIWLQTQLLSAGLENDLSHLEKSCIADKFPQILKSKS